jgi:hypothetical protein
MDSVHGPSTTSDLDPRWTMVVRPRARQCACWSTMHRRYGLPTVVTRGGGGRGGCGGAEGGLTEDGAAVKRPGDGGKAAVM